MPQHYCPLYEMFQANHKYGTGKRLDEKDPFYGYKMAQDETAPVFLTYPELKSIMDKEFTIPRLALVRDIFVFACFTGLAFVNVSTLKKDNLVQDNNGDWWIRKGRVKLEAQTPGIFCLQHPPAAGSACHPQKIRGTSHMPKKKPLPACHMQSTHEQLFEGNR